MKHIFILNPAAGRKKHHAEQTLLEKLSKYDGQLSYELYTTTGRGDATRFVRERCEAEPDELLRFYACGGDGTANEVLHGVIGHDNASMTCYPCGSGNDFIKYYGKAEDFLDLDSLIAGKEKAIDVMRVGDRYSMNTINFGFEAAVVETMEKVRRTPILGGRNSYTTGIVAALFGSMKNKCTVFVDGEQINDGVCLLGNVANGRYAGGAFRCAPYSQNDDGLLEVCLVRPISRFTFVKLVNVYSEGQHIDDPRFRNIVCYRRGKTIRVVAEKESFAYVMDGELFHQKEFTIEVCPGAVRFAVPAALLSAEEREGTEVSEPSAV